MVGLICLWKSCGIGYGSVIMSVVWVVVCWGFDASVWTCPLRELWVVCCVGVWFWYCDNCYLHGEYVWVCIIGAGRKIEGVKWL